MVHLTYLNGAARALTDALQIHDRQVDREDARRDSYEIAKCIDLCHLGVARMLKHAVAQHDPYLLLTNPKAEVLRNLRGAMMHRGAPSIFATAVRADTLDSVVIAEKVVREVLYPKLDATEYEAFVSALKTLVHLRNAVQHGELFGTADELLADVRKVLSEAYAISTQICPDLPLLIREIDVQASGRLHAYREELDGAWTVLVHHLLERTSVEIPFRMEVTRAAENNPYRIEVQPNFGANTLRCETHVPWQHAQGLFRVDRVGGLGRRLQRMVKSDEQFTEFNVAGSSTPQRAKSPRPRSMQRALFPPLAEREPIYPLDDGSLSVDSAAATLYVLLTEGDRSKPSFSAIRRGSLTVDAILQDWSFELKGDQLRAPISGTLLSSRPGGPNAALSIGGWVSLQAEHLIIPEEPTLLPIDTARFDLYGVFVLSLASSGD